MTATPTTTREADAYLAEVRNHLADLGEDERAELLEDLAQHLSDISTDEGNVESDLRALLGDPANYAAELRAAAGLPPRTTTQPELPEASWTRRASALWNHPKSLALRKLAGELAPAWWVLRGLLVVALVVATADQRWRHIPIPHVYGSRLWGLFAIGVAVALSVAVGRAGYGGWKRILLLGDFVVALGALSLTLQALSTGYVGLGHPTESVVYADNPSTALESPHGPVTNIYPYDAQGRPLEGVLLFDQDGRPMRVADQEWWPDGCRRNRDYPLAADGVPVEFSFPQRYGLVPEPGRQGCLLTIPRPAVPLPTFPDTSPAPPAEPAQPSNTP